MSNTEQKNRSLMRDGTSQTGRCLPELEPDFVQIDERNTRDLLAFAEGYARHLKFHSVEDQPGNPGDWSGFIGPGIDLDGAAAYAREPETFLPEQATAFSRPHFALLLTFLELLGHTRRQINGITRRHLEFFYRDVLKMVRKQAVPDQVHALVELEHGTDQQRLPKGTAVTAGKDSLGQPLVYRTERELIANKVEIGQLSSLYTEMKTTGIKETCPPSLSGSNRKEAFVAMLEIALGQPNPGDPLPTPTYPFQPSSISTDKVVDFDVLKQAQALIGVVESELYMPLFDDFRDLMRWKTQRQDNDSADWTRINDFLETTAKTSELNDSHDFETNLKKALGKNTEEFTALFNGITEVENIEEAYDACINRVEEIETIELIEEALKPLPLDAFISLMNIKRKMDNEWEEINRLLEKAGKNKRNGVDFTLPSEKRASQEFDSKFAAALDSPDYIVEGGLDNYFKVFREVEKYFYMSAEDFRDIMWIVTGEDASISDEGAWNKVYDFVTNAHREMIYARRRNVLKAVAQPDPNIAIKDNINALSAVLAVVLGKKLPLDEALKELGSFGVDKGQKDLNGILNNKETINWTNIYKVLEVAQRNREDFQAPQPEKVEWRNLYPATDAQKILAQPSQPDTESLPRWKTFGRVEQNKGKEPVPPATLGWALMSSLLDLSEGERTITLTLGFSAEAEKFDIEKIQNLLTNADPNPFQVQLSTAKGWLDTVSQTVKQVDYPHSMDKDVDTSKLRALVFEVTLSQSQPALAPLTYDVHGIDTPVPVLRLMLKPIWHENGYAIPSYAFLRNLLLLRTHLKVSVTGLADLCIGNDQSNLDAKKPFEPFGSEPAVGSRFYFGHKEIVGKKLDSLSFNITWMGVPTKLSEHYENYPEYPDPDNSTTKKKLDNTSFKAKVCLVEGNVLTNFPDSLPLFNEKNAHTNLTIMLSPPEDQGNPDNAQTDPLDVSEWHRYLLWELKTPDFQHAVYPKLAIEKSLKMTAAIAKDPSTIKPGIYQVNPAYTPKIKNLNLDYSASAEIAINTLATEATTMRAFYVGPFGYAELKPDGAQHSCPFLPQFNFEGELYIGLRNVTPPMNLSLLFQVAEGSADPDLKAEPVQWSYLSGNRWHSLQDEGSLVADATRGLINSGIVELALKPVQPSTILPEGLYWIRTAITRSSSSVCDMVAIHPNALLATFADDHNAADHLGSPLPAERISEPMIAIPGVARLHQPYTSFAGKMAEQDTSFYIRVSERLRHKNRALTPWDYERLVLENFPQIYKVKCLRTDPLMHGHEPGRIELVVIPDIRNRLPSNPFEPKAPADQIRDIQVFLRNKTPPFADVEVKNAHYIPLRVRCGIRFMPGQDVGFCLRQLNEELNRFLSPWAYEEGADLVIGGSIYANSIINFIDSREYVDYLAGFKMFTGLDKHPVKETTDGYHASADRPDGILVAAHTHDFDVISDANYRVEDFAGINYMKIELDFEVA